MVLHENKKSCLSRQRGHLNICCYIGWIILVEYWLKYCICHLTFTILLTGVQGSAQFSWFQWFQPLIFKRNQCFESGRASHEFYEFSINSGFCVTEVKSTSMLYRWHSCANWPRTDGSVTSWSKSQNLVRISSREAAISFFEPVLFCNNYSPFLGSWFLLLLCPFCTNKNITMSSSFDVQKSTGTKKAEKLATTPR